MIKDILQGKYDDQLQDILDAVTERQKLKRNVNNAVAMSTINIGDKVRLKELRPKYINGEKAKVVKKYRTKFGIRLDKGTVGKFSGVIKCPASCLEKI